MTYKNDKNISNISFINKDFESLWTEILALIPKLTNKWVPSEANESDPLAVLLKEQAIMTDKINYNVDKNILELFPQSLTQLRSAYDVYNSMGYYPDWYVSATVDLTLSRNGKVLVVQNSTTDAKSDDNSINSTTNDTQPSTSNGKSLFIDVFTSFSDSESKTVYVTKRAHSFEINESALIPAIQGTALDFAVDNDRCITTDYLDAQNRIYFTESNVAQNGIFISEKNDYSDLRNTDSVWKRVDNLSQELSGQKVYKFGVDAVNNACYIQFPNDIGSLIGSGLYIKYIKSDGINGNVTVKTITQFFDDITIKNLDSDGNENVLVAADDSSVKINDLFTYTTNLLGATNGKDPMTIDEMNLGYDKVKNVFNTLVTLLDYKNYLYNYQDANSRNIVSNIQVSDRSNDLYQSYTVKSFDTANNINVDIVKSDIKSDGTINSTASLTAYNIRFYPLAYSSDVASLGNFNNTFTQITNVSSIDSAIQEVKSLNHDVLDNGSPVILTYDLDGYIYLNDKVSQIDANQIKNNVVTALWDRFNSRQLGFGEMPDYGELVDTIKSADDRISYVALNPITTYKQKEDDTFNEYYSSLDIIKRSILAGITPWSKRHSDLQVKFGQIYNNLVNDQSVDYSNLPIKTDINNQPQLQTSCLVHESSLNPQSYVDYDCTIGDTKYDSNTLHIYQNELLSVTYPTYRESVVYTNYLYYEYKLLRSFKSGQIYSLQKDEYIKLYEKKGDTKVYKTLQITNNKPVFVKLNFDLAKGQSSSMTSIGLNTISEMELVKYECDFVSRSNNAFTKQYDSLYFSDKQLLESVSQLTQGDFITIPTGSYVIRITNDENGNPLQFEIISEGSTIQLSDNCKISDNINELLRNYKAYQVDLAFLNEYGDLQGISSKSYPVCDLITLTDSNKAASIILQLNDIQTFGNGCDVYFYDNDNSDVRLNLKSINLSDTIPFSIKSSDSNRSLAYRQSTDDDYTYVSFGDLAVTGYYGLCIDNAVSQYQPLYQTVGTLESLVSDNDNVYHDIAAYGKYIGVKYVSKSTTSLVLNSTATVIPENDELEIYNKDGAEKVTLLAKYVGDQITYIKCDKELTLTANADIQYVSLGDDEFLHIAIQKTQNAVYIGHKQCVYYSVLGTDNRNYTLLTNYANLPIDTNLYINFSKIINISIQQKLNLTESDTFNVYVYRFNGTYKNTDDYITNSTGVTLPKYRDNNKTLPVVIRCVLNDKSVKYVLTTTSGETLQLSNNVKYYQPILYTADAKVYTGTDNETAVEVALLDIYSNREDKTKNYVELDTTYLYDAQFDPTYEPTDSIDKPTDTSTYFNKNHILNRYVMAQLKGYNSDNTEATSSNPLPNLKISDLSIIK